MPAAVHYPFRTKHGWCKSPEGDLQPAMTYATRTVWLMGDGTWGTDWRPDSEQDVALRFQVLPYPIRDGWSATPTPGVHTERNIRYVYHLGDGSKLTDGTLGDTDVLYLHRHLPYWTAEGVWTANPSRAINIGREEDTYGPQRPKHLEERTFAELERGITPRPWPATVECPAALPPPMGPMGRHYWCMQDMP